MSKKTFAILWDSKMDFRECLSAAAVVSATAPSVVMSMRCTVRTIACFIVLNFYSGVGHYRYPLRVKQKYVLPVQRRKYRHE